MVCWLLSNNRAAKMFGRLEFAAEVAFLLIRQLFSLQETGQHLGLHLNHVLHIWVCVAKSKVHNVVAIRNKAFETAIASRFSKLFLRHTAIIWTSLADLFLKFPRRSALSPSEQKLSFRTFYEAERNFDPRFLAVRYAPRPARLTPPAQLKASSRQLVLLCCDRRRFNVIFLGESVVCLSNFEKRQ